MFEIKLGRKFADLTADLDKLRKGEKTNKSWIFNPLKIRYESDAKQWLTDLENFLTKDFETPHTSYLLFASSSKKKIREEGQDYQDELIELAEFLYHNGEKSDKLLAELAREKEMIAKGKSFYFQQIKNTSGELIKSYLAEMIKVIELREKSCQVVKNIGSFYQYFANPELLKLSSFSSQFELLSTQISSSVNSFVERIDKEYEISSHLDLFLRGIRIDGCSNEYWYGNKKQAEVQNFLVNFANKPVEDIEITLLSYEALINLLREILNAPGGQLKPFLTKRHEKEFKDKIETITNLEQAKEIYWEISQYLYNLRQIAKKQIELVDEDLQEAKNFLGEDITDHLTKPKEDFVQDNLFLEKFTKMIRGQIQQIITDRTVDNLEIAHRDNTKKDQLTTDLEGKRNQTKILEKKIKWGGIPNKSIKRRQWSTKRTKKNKGKLGELNRKLSEINEEKKKRGEKIGELVAELKVIRNEFNRSKTEITKKEVEFQKITSEKNEIDEELKESFKNLESKDYELADKQEELAQLRTELVSLQGDNFSLAAEKNFLESQLSNLQKEKENIEKKYDELNENLSQENTVLKDKLTQAQSDFQREKEKVNNYETELTNKLEITDVKYWKDVVTSLKTRPEQATLDAANDKIVNLAARRDALEVEKQTLSDNLTAMTNERDVVQATQVTVKEQVATYENGLKTIFGGETIVKDGVVAKVIPTNFEPSQFMLNIATWKNNIYDKPNNSQSKSELKRAKQELYDCKSKLFKWKKEMLQKFITQLELKLEGEEITSTKVIQAIKELLGRTPGQETSLRSENKDQENQITNLNKILAGANYQKNEFRNKLAKINKENTNLTSQNKQLQSQLSQKEKEKLLGIIFGVESGVVLMFIVLLLMFKKKKKNKQIIKLF